MYSNTYTGTVAKVIDHIDYLVVILTGHTPIGYRVHKPASPATLIGQTITITFKGREIPGLNRVIYSNFGDMMIHPSKTEQALQHSIKVGALIDTATLTKEELFNLI